MIDHGAKKKELNAGDLGALAKLNFPPKVEAEVRRVWEGENSNLFANFLAPVMSSTWPVHLTVFALAAILFLNSFFPGIVILATIKAVGIILIWVAAILLVLAALGFGASAAEQPLERMNVYLWGLIPEFYGLKLGVVAVIVGLLFTANAGTFVVCLAVALLLWGAVCFSKQATQKAIDKIVAADQEDAE